MASRPQEEENLLLDLYDDPKEEISLLDFEDAGTAVKPSVKVQPPQDLLSGSPPRDTGDMNINEGLKVPRFPESQSVSPTHHGSFVHTSSPFISADASSVTVVEPYCPDFWEMHPHLKGLGEREGKYRSLNEKSMGNPGVLTPKFATNLLKYKEGELCLHDGDFTRVHERWQQCAHCKSLQSRFVIECRGSKSSGQGSEIYQSV
ncbi:hypothetical protein TWF730_004967 [Orbilia blumenaviensis]|uniref:Uncharacterized protein n=1 Tax=Orbilia blumenaviensis TaxID=1796055 RepID=A0AAV9VGV0_9PEZI